MSDSTETRVEVPFPDHLTNDLERKAAYDKLKEMGIAGDAYTLICENPAQVNRVRVRFHEAAKQRFLSVKTHATTLDDGTIKVTIAPDNWMEGTR
jgi:hypothetical protein